MVERGSQRLGADDEGLGGGAHIMYATRGYHGRRRTGQVFGFNRRCRRRRRHRTSQCVRAVAMPRTSFSLLMLLWSFCAAAVCALAAAVSVAPPPSFRSANLTAATLLATTAGGKYGRTLLSGDEMAVSVQEYADCAVFRVQARTRGYVALAFADHVIPTRPVDVLLAWVDDETGTGYLLVSEVARKRLDKVSASTVLAPYKKPKPPLASRISNDIEKIY